MRSFSTPVAAALLAVLAASSAACANDPFAARKERAGTSSRDGVLPRSPTSAHDEQFFRVEGLVSQWDAAQADGLERDADAFAAKIREEVDRDFATFSGASRGEYGVKAQYVGIKALGFSGNPAATTLLSDRLGDSDPRLVGNALIGLKIRSDPKTPLPAIVSLIRSPLPEPRRFAPLALANVVLARERAAVPLESRTADDAETGLVALVRDHDPVVRLHVAKAFGALRRSTANDYLAILLGDEHVQIRLAAAAALERIGDPRSFPKVVDLLETVPDDAKPIVRDVLVSYAERIRGSPLTAAERASLGTSRRAWDLWFAANQRPAAAPRRG